jgi:nucleoside-diphosphate-sugar epimerase
MSDLTNYCYSDALSHTHHHYLDHEVLGILAQLSWPAGERRVFDVTIAELAQLIADVVGFTGRFVFDASKPDGTPRKRLDVSKLAAFRLAHGAYSSPAIAAWSGSALIRRLTQEECRVLTAGRDAGDLRDQAAVDRWFDERRSEAVLLAAARVGGIHENDTHPGDFLYDNLAIATNVIEASRRTGAAKLAFLGSSCIYPRLAPQPMPESCLLTGPLEPTNQWYAIAKELVM